MLKVAAFFDNLLNSITMYRLTLYGLIALSAISILFGFLGLLPFSGTSFIFSLVLLLVVCFVSNFAFSKLFNAPTNHESVYITALILFLLMFPPQNTQEMLIVGFSGVLAMGSKFIVATHFKHIFNPAAFSAVILGALGIGYTIWWVGSPVLFPFTLIIGLLVVRKIRKFTLLLTFLATALVSLTIFGIINNADIQEVIKVAFLSGPIIFFGTVMLTEPSTTPPNRKTQMMYGILVGALYGVQYKIGPLYSTPELALVFGNLFSYVVSFKEKLVLVLDEKRELAKGAYEFVFKTTRKMNFIPGQYLEWTLPGTELDSRGNRRYFTIASSPTEDRIRLGVRFYQNPSKFKTKLLSLTKGSKLTAGQLAGDFVLPDDKTKKLVFVAGGIGITPFRSILKYLMDNNEKLSIILLYTNKTEEEIAYRDFLDEAQTKLGIEVVHVLTEQDSLPKGLHGTTGHLNEEIIKKYAPDYEKRTFYISGSNAMVNSVKQLLNRMGVNSSNITTDYFPGF